MPAPGVKVTGAGALLACDQTATVLPLYILQPTE